MLSGLQLEQYNLITAEGMHVHQLQFNQYAFFTIFEQTESKCLGFKNRVNSL